MEKSDKILSVAQKINYNTRTEQILLVDDKKMIALIGKKMLERLGYQVTVRTSSMNGLDTFNTDPDALDLVITDMNMPNMTGEKLAQELISIRPDIPIIICTSFSGRMDV